MIYRIEAEVSTRVEFYVDADDEEHAETIAHLIADEAAMAYGQGEDVDIERCELVQEPPKFAPIHGYRGTWHLWRADQHVLFSSSDTPWPLLVPPR